MHLFSWSRFWLSSYPVAEVLVLRLQVGETFIGRAAQLLAILAIAGAGRIRNRGNVRTIHQVAKTVKEIDELDNAVVVIAKGLQFLFGFFHL